MKPLISFLFFVIFLALFAYGIFWLWQRQPHPKAQSADQLITLSSPSPKPPSNLKPEDFSVIKDPNTTFNGKAQANSFVALFTDTVQTLASADSNGTFSKELKLTPGLNLVTITYINPDLKINSQKTLTLDVSTSQKGNGSTIFAGSVKSTFQNSVTISTLNGDKTVNIKEGAQISIPQNPDSQDVESGISAIRVGDYMIALGDITGTDTIDSSLIQIIRENKPTVSQKIDTVEILTAPKLNSFEAKSMKSQQIINFDINSNTTIESENKLAKTTAIAANKKAAVIYESGNDNNTVDYIYLFP